MADLTASAALNLENIIASGAIARIFDFGVVETATSTTFSIAYNDGTSTTSLGLVGTFGDYVDGYPTTGTVTSAVYFLNGVTQFSFFGLSIAAGQFISLARANNDAQLFQTLLLGSDQIFGSAESDVLLGFDGNDLIDGSGGNDVLRGGGGNDNLDGGMGSDTLDGGTGNDIMRGGAGNDFFLIDSGSDGAIEAVGQGFDTAFTTASFSLEAGSEVEALRVSDATSTTAINLTGNEFGQILSGNNGANRLFGLGGDDYLEGRGGIDTLDGGAGADVLIGGAGDDFYVVDSVLDRIIENVGEGFDTVFTSISLSLAAGNNLEALRALETPGVALDLFGNEQGQILAGNESANRLYGFGGDDYLEGRGGIDTLDGGTGGDTMRGGTGDDFYIIDNTGDRTLENVGEGFDTAFVDASFGLEAGMEVEALRASNASSTARMDLFGNEFGQVIQGNEGVNLLVGGGGDDYLESRGGDDRLEGGAGADVLIGGSGIDIFAFGELGSTDRVLDFVSGTDRIDLRSIDANTNTAGDDAFTLIGASDFTNVAGQLRSYSSGGVNYLAGDVDGNGTADFVIDLGTAQVISADLLF